MNYLILLFTAVAVTGQNVIKQKYNKRAKGGAFLFSAIAALCAMMFFVVIGHDFHFRSETFLSSVLFAVSYTTATLGSILAIRHGSLAKTTLIISCSLLIPSFYGMIILQEPISPTLIIGTIMLVVALFLIHYERGNASEENRITWKWLIFVTMAFLGNGMCSTVQKAEQLKYGIDGKNMFMVIALLMSGISMLIAAVLSSRERSEAKDAMNRGWWLAVICGCMNGLSNFLVIYLNDRLPASVMFPVISGGGVVLIFLYSYFINKEHFSPRQLVGYALGTISIILLNL